MSDVPISYRVRVAVKQNRCPIQMFTAVKFGLFFGPGIVCFVLFSE